MRHLPTSLVRSTIGAVRPLAAGERTPFAVQRVVAELAALASRPARGVHVEPAVVGGVRGERATPATVVPGRAMLYLHGGGYVIGSSATHRSGASTLAGGLAARTFVADYRRAPEHQYPAALEDALRAYRALRVESEQVFVCGDSAGAGLALALSVRLRDAGEVLPDALGLICPWLDLACERRIVPRDPLLRPGTLKRWAEAYVPDGMRAQDPALSPLLAELRGLPPIVVQSAGDDPLLPDADRLEVRARAAGVRIEHQHNTGLWHDFQMSGGMLAEGDRALARLSVALLARLDGARPVSAQAVCDTPSISG